mmetsp:Transcript_37627/g.95039  ORF Transcript_37627/g.95039 Transcript_37627/m.95039 type:complete len:256 (+) Transcript_37627:1257-2024(+)
MLEVRGIRRVVDSKVILTNVNFDLQAGEVLFVRGPSGCGKTLLLRCLACLDQAQAGDVWLGGKSPRDLGYPEWRARVMYIPQARVALPGTPSDFYFSAQQLKSQRGRPRGDLPALVHDMGLEQAALNQPWSTLSGGQAQRALLALAVALQPDVLLLDEPTSACDAATARRVERALAGCGAACVWVTHDTEQPHRLGGRLLELPTGAIYTLPPPPPQASTLLMPGPADVLGVHPASQAGGSGPVAPAPMTMTPGSP